MKTIVMKFGGASVATPQHFSKIADIVSARAKQFDRVAVVVSAMGNTTNQLIELAKQVNPNPPRREYDMLVSGGERISISLLAMALALKNREATSFTGSQTGIITCDKHTEARIINVKPHRLLTCFEAGKIVIVAGFQGVSKGGEITTLGRGGSDTTAVALGIALNANVVEFFKDVPGVFNCDPKLDPNAYLIERMSYEHALAIVASGAKVLHPRCVELARKNNLPLHVCSFKDNGEKIGTVIEGDGSPRRQEPLFEDV